MEERKIDYIFYLQTKSDLGRAFYQMAETFSDLGVTLLPISFDQLRNLEKNKKIHLVVLRNDFASATLFQEVHRNFLNTLILTGKVTLYDLSSFSELSDQGKIYKKENYKYFQLPLDVEQTTLTISESLFRENNEEVETWPGGRRAKLPTMDI